MTIDAEKMAARQHALASAKMFMDPIFESYPLEAYKTVHAPAVVFSVPPGSTMTPADQAVDLILQIADWLLDERE